MSANRPRTRLYCDQDLSAGKLIAFDRDQSGYLTKVLRLKSGAEVGLFNERQGEWRATIEPIAKREIVAHIGTHLIDCEAPSGISLVFAPIKKAPLEWMLIKATELGIDSFQPVITQHTQAELIRPDRMAQLILEACEQCERCSVPRILGPLPLADWAQDAPRFLYGAESGKAHGIDHAFADLDPKVEQILVGPEGGFSAQEFEMLAKLSHADAINLGPRILKAETAAVALTTIAMIGAQQFSARPAFRT